MDIREFAKQFKLKLDVRIHSKKTGHRIWHKDELHYYVVSFENVQIDNGRIVINDYGSGDTEDQAIEEYAIKISHKILVILRERQCVRKIKTYLLTLGECCDII